MRHRHFVSILSVLGLVTTAAANAAPGAPPGQGTLQVGADSRTVLPLVDGSHDYLEAGFPERGNAFDPGIPVPKWDDGRIAVGNGESESYWVHDDIRVTALAIDDPRSPHIVVIVATDLYMVFRNDGERDPRQGCEAAAAGHRQEAQGGGDGLAQSSRPGHGVRREPRLVRLHGRAGRRDRGRSGQEPPSRAPAGGVGRALVRHERRHRPEHLRPAAQRAAGDRHARAGDRDHGAVEPASGGDAGLGAAARGDRGRLPDARPHRQQLQRRGSLLHVGLRRCPARGPGRALRRRGGVPERRARRADRSGWIGCLGGHQRTPAGQPAQGAGRRRGAGRRHQLHATQLPPWRGHR